MNITGEENAINNESLDLDLEKLKIRFVEKIEAFLSNKSPSNESSLKRTIKSKKREWGSQLKKFGRSIGWNINFSEKDMVKWFKSIALQNISKATQRNYRSIIYSFGKWLGKDISAVKWAWVTKKEMPNSISFKNYIKKIYTFLDENYTWKDSAKRGYASLLLSLSEFTNWTLDCDKSEILAWINSERVKKLKFNSCYTYILRIRRFLDWMGKDTQYLSQFIESNMNDKELKYFIENSCVLGGGKMILQKRLLIAMNKYLIKKGLPQITKPKLTLCLKGIHVKTNPGAKYKGRRCYFGIDLSIEGEKKYGVMGSLDKKEMIEEVKQRPREITAKTACVIMNFNPTIELLSQFTRINEIKENQDALQKIIVGICKLMTLKCVSRRPKVILGLALYLGIDTYNTERIAKMLSIDLHSIPSLLKKIIPNELNVSRLCKSAKKDIRDYFINLVEPRLSIKNNEASGRSDKR